MSEELIQRNLIEAPEKMGDWNFYNIGATTLKALKGAKIIPDKDYEAYEGKKPDALIVKKPIIIGAIEYKTPQELRTEKQIAKAIAQEIGTAQILQAKVYIVTDGRKTFWINPATGQEILQEDGSRITLNFDKSSTECITLINKIRASINATNNQIKAAASVDPLPLAEKVWQDLWAVSGATPENCLYTFVEIFIFKYLSDLGVLKGMYSFYDLLGKYSGNNENEVLEYYASTVRVKIKALFPGNPKDKTTIINGTIFVSKLRDFILEQCEIDAVISLPLNTFFTTNKKTYILALTKKAPVMVDGVPTLQRQISPVFTYLCSEIGETRDVYRFDINQNDLQVASDLFNMFKGAKTSFANTLNMIGDRRCKISSIDDFYNGTHWCVERWWNHEERQALGIEEESKTIGGTDFRVLLADTINTLSELDEPLAEVEKKNDEGLQFLEIPITQVFDIVRGDGKYTRSYVHEHTGEHPLYSGNTFGPFAQIDSYDYNVPALTWAIDGLAGYMMIHRSPFSATNHRGILLLKDTNIDLEYAKYTLEPIFRELKKGRQGDNGENEYTSLPPFMIQSVKFAIPVDHDGEPWLEKQKEIAAGYVTLEQTKETVVEQIANLSQVSVVPNCDEYAIEYLPLSELFDTIKGKSKYTKKYGNLHSGPYPVYSASSQGTLTHLDTYDYDGRYMTWSTNGFAGTILILNGKFSINGDRGILVPKNGRQDLDFDYMKFTLEPIFRELAKGRKGDNGEDEFTKLYPSMLSDIMVPIPVDGKGNISLLLQKEIAQKFISVQNSQKEIIEKLDALISKKISM